MTKIQKILPIFASILFLGVVFNLIFLDYKFFSQKEEVNLGEKETVATSPAKIVDSCHPLSCPELIRQATASLKLQATQGIPVVEKTTSGAKEFSIHLGSGSSTTDQWADIPGAEAYIDSTRYGRIKDVFFEASLYTPTGNQTAYVRLYNVTDKNVVWPSELSIEGGQPKLLVSPSMTLPSGNKLYRVQMKTQLKSLTNLVQARVRIITE